MGKGPGRGTRGRRRRTPRSRRRDAASDQLTGGAAAPKLTGTRRRGGRHRNRKNRGRGGKGKARMVSRAELAKHGRDADVLGGDGKWWDAPKKEDALGVAMSGLASGGLQEAHPQIQPHQRLEDAAGVGGDEGVRGRATEGVHKAGRKKLGESKNGQADEESEGVEPVDGVWMAIDGKVYDISLWLHEHPGGEDILLQHAGELF
jgi:hypothetical protein